MYLLNIDKECEFSPALYMLKKIIEPYLPLSSIATTSLVSGISRIFQLLVDKAEFTHIVDWIGGSMSVHEEGVTAMNWFGVLMLLKM